MPRSSRNPPPPPGAGEMRQEEDYVSEVQILPGEEQEHQAQRQVGRPRHAHGHVI